MYKLSHLIESYEEIIKDIGDIEFFSSTITVNLKDGIIITYFVNKMNFFEKIKFLWIIGSYLWSKHDE